MNACPDCTRRHPGIELQRRFSAAIEEMNVAWTIYRQDREDAEKLHRYTRATTRCQTLKDAIFRHAAKRREERWAA